VLDQLGVGVENHIGEVATVVEDHVQGTVGATEEQGLLDAPVGFFLRLAFPGKNTDTCCGNRGSGVVLRGEDITGAPLHFGAKGNQGFDKNGCLDGHVKATGDAGAFQRLRWTVLVTDRHEAGHFGFGEADFFAAPFGETHVLHLVRKAEIEV
jgi:hypothetical protein